MWQCNLSANLSLKFLNTKGRWIWILAALDPWCWGRRLSLETLALIFVMFLPQGHAAGVPFTQNGSETLPCCSPHCYSATNRIFLAQPLQISMHSWCLVCSSKQITLKKSSNIDFHILHFTLHAIVKPQWSTRLSDLKFCTQLKMQFLFFLISLSCVVPGKNLKNMIWNSARNLLKCWTEMQESLVAPGLQTQNCWTRLLLAYICSGFISLVIFSLLHFLSILM